MCNWKVPNMGSEGSKWTLLGVVSVVGSGERSLSRDVLHTLGYKGINYWLHFCSFRPPGGNMAVGMHGDE